MNLFFNEDSQKLIICAKKEMMELKHPYVGSEHLLLSILKNTDLGITKILNSYSITYDKFRDELINVVGFGSRNNEWFLFTPLLKRIINNACYYSKDKNRIVTPDSLLISILQEGDGVANRILIGMNIDVVELYNRFLVIDNISGNETPLLDELAINMNECSINGMYDPVIGRNKELEEIIQILLRKNKSNPLLIGEAGVGKTAVIEELARQISLGCVPYKLKNKTIYSISMSVLVSGTKYRGEFEEKIHKLVNELKNNPNIILFIDEVHTLMGAGGAEGAIDASNILKPYLARGEITVIGATTVGEYKKYIEKDKALNRRFQKVYIEEANRDEVKNILINLKNIYEDYHGVNISDSLLDTIIDVSYTCIPFGRQPDKAIDLLDEVCSYSEFSKTIKDRSLYDYELKIKNIEELKNKEIMNHNFKQALVYKDKEMSLRNDYNNKLFYNNGVNDKIKINKDDISKVIYNKVNLPYKDDYIKKLNEVKDIIIGKFCEYKKEVCIIFDLLKKYDYIKNNKPLVMLFVGKSDNTMTFLVEELVKNMFFCKNYIHLDMLEYSSYQSISKIVGVAPGYVGYNDDGVFDSININPFTIILLDNIDKCNRKILSFLKKSFSTGYVEKSYGNKINIRKCIVFMTSNSLDNDIGFIYNEKDDNNYFGNVIKFRENCEV